MSPDRIGRVLRALRHERDWTQATLAARAGCSRSVISRLERGNLRACSMELLQRVFACVDAVLFLAVRWRGGELDRLLDADHARLGERWAVVRGAPWLARAEVTYSEFGERGSIDELAFDPVSGTLVCTELKTGIYEANRVVAKLDEKARLARGIGRRLGWRVERVVPALVIADTRTNRRRVAEHEALFGRFGCRGRAAQAWLRDPADPSAGCSCSFRCQMCVGRTVGERAGSACGRCEGRRAWLNPNLAPSVTPDERLSAWPRRA